MDAACHLEYKNEASSNPAKYSEFSNKDSWYCVDEQGNNLGPIDINWWCGEKYAGSVAYLAEDNAYGWKCKR